jgi:hypothetical protein
MHCLGGIRKNDTAANYPLVLCVSGRTGGAVMRLSVGPASGDGLARTRMEAAVTRV